MVEPDPETNSKTRIPRKSFVKRWSRRLLFVFVAICILLVIADLGYSIFVHSKLRSWESKCVRNSEGVRQGCEAFSLGPKSSPTALLLVHGIGDSPHIYRKVAKYLSEQGLYCRSMRLKGFGESVENYSKATIDDWLGSVESEVKELRKEFKKVVIVAHSLGGAVSIRFIADRREAIDGLILAAPAIEVSSQRSPVLKVRVWHQVLRRILIFTRTTYSPFGVDAVDESERVNELQTPFAPLKLIDRVFVLLNWNRNDAGKVEVPTLMVLAEKDKVIDNGAAREFFKELGSDRKELLVLDNSAHAIPVDYQWKDFCAAILDFVK